ncbi:MAG TPA: amidohydrolase family protein [Bacteroidia bacterium]|nr:amidohydrolase family protein [Bacteroidia bacterium]
MRKIASDWLFTGTVLLPRHTVVLDADGRVESVQSGVEADAEWMDGLISPGFVNAHCHLELSHLKGQIPKHTGMAGFVRTLQPLRDKFSDAEKESAMQAALVEMQATGIVAIGDICNGLSSLPVKKAHPEVIYHNFIEQFGLNPAMAEEIFLRGLELLREFGRGSSITLHAPYSMSVALRDKLLQYAHRREWPQSIHLLESKEERQLFEDLDGPLMDFIRDIGAVFQAHTYRTVVDFVTESLPQNCNVLFVHNTEMTAAELVFIAEGWPRTYFVLCPLANAYIHDRLPDAPSFAAYPDRICLGTDSLAGNESLSLLAEMHCLQTAHALPSELLLRWATLNGAKALGLDLDRFKVAAGSRPILIQIPEFIGAAPFLPAHSHVQYLKTCS